MFITTIRSQQMEFKEIFGRICARDANELNFSDAHLHELHLVKIKTDELNLVIKTRNEKLIEYD